MTSGDALLDRIIEIARTARGGGFGVLSTGEQLAAALVLNRADWLASINFTMSQAMERLGTEWLDRIPSASLEFAYDPPEPTPPARAKPLTDEQAAIVLAVLERNHAHYVANGMSPAHMWPVEVATEIRNEFRHERTNRPGIG